jgi:hypothetical protein
MLSKPWRPSLQMYNVFFIIESHLHALPPTNVLYDFAKADNKMKKKLYIIFHISC